MLAGRHMTGGALRHLDCPPKSLACCPLARCYGVENRPALRLQMAAASAPDPEAGKSGAKLAHPELRPPSLHRARMIYFHALCNEGRRISTVQPSSAQESGPPQTAHLAAAAAARFFRRAHHQLFGELQIIARPYPHHHRGKLCKFWPGRTRTPPPWTSRATCSCC